jgi:hypothetical protein
MCIPVAMAALGIGGTAATTVAGSTAAAATVGSTLSTIGTAVSIGSALMQGIVGYQSAKAQSDAIDSQMKTEAQLNATKEQRARAEFRSQIAQQRAELAARGVQLDSVTAVMLGQTAAAEMSFESQAIRSDGQARQVELSASKAAAKADGVLSLIKGGASAAGTFVKAAPDIWPGFMDKRVGGLT